SCSRQKCYSCLPSWGCTTTQSSVKQFVLKESDRLKTTQVGTTSPKIVVYHDWRIGRSNLKGCQRLVSLPERRGNRDQTCRSGAYSDCIGRDGERRGGARSSQTGHDDGFHEPESFYTWGNGAYPFRWT